MKSDGRPIWWRSARSARSVIISVILAIQVCIEKDDDKHQNEISRRNKLLTRLYRFLPIAFMLLGLFAYSEVASGTEPQPPKKELPQVLLIGDSVALASTSKAKVSESRRRPNFLFIIVDDQSPFDFKFYNPKSALQSPNIDRLAAQGMVFDAAHHMGAFVGAVCTPSRHMIMSGRTVWHLPIGPEAEKYCPPNLEQSTLAALFNRAGYDTMRTCKLGNSYEGANKQFTVRHDASKRGSTDESGSPWHGDQVMNYLTEREAKKDADPFLIYFGFSHPHDTRDGRPELLEKYGAVNHTDRNSLPPTNPKQPALPVNYLSAHPFPHGHPDLRDETTVSGVWENRDERTIRNELGRDFACSEAIDIQA